MRLYRNKEGYTDKTAGDAIKAADTKPEPVSWLIDTMHQLAHLMGYEVVGRVTIRDKDTGREWR